MSQSHTDSDAVERARNDIHQALRLGTTPEALDPLLARYEQALMAEHGRAALFRGAYTGASRECDRLRAALRDMCALARSLDDKHHQPSCSPAYRAAMELLSDEERVELLRAAEQRR